jgi:hypothetical protein
MDGETRIHSDVSGVVPDCTELVDGKRLYFEDVGDVELVEGRGIGFPNCTFDRTRRGNR